MTGGFCNYVNEILEPQLQFTASTPDYIYLAYVLKDKTNNPSLDVFSRNLMATFTAIVKHASVFSNK